MNLFSRNVVIHSFHGQMVYLPYLLDMFTSRLLSLQCPCASKWTFIHLVRELRRHKRSNKCMWKGWQTKKCYSCAVFLFNYIYFIAFICPVFPFGVLCRKEKWMLSQIWMTFGLFFYQKIELLYHHHIQTFGRTHLYK